MTDEDLGPGNPGAVGIRQAFLRAAIDGRDPFACNGPPVTIDVDDLLERMNDAPAAPPDWARLLVERLAFAHAFRNGRACIGWTSTTSGTAQCGRDGCRGWRITARLDAAGSGASARFAFAALATVGTVVAAATWAAQGALAEAVLGWMTCE